MRGAHRPGFVWGRGQRGTARRLVVTAVLACGLVFTGAYATCAHADANPIGAHSTLQVNSSYALMQAMFSEAANLHAGAIRVDVAPALIFPDRPADPDYRGLDEIMGLARQYHLRIVADLFTIPAWLADCPPPGNQSVVARCGTDDLAGYGSVVQQIVGHADSVIHDWEIWNEPDSGQFFSGTPQQYAGMLRAAHDAIKQADPQGNVLLGGISNPAGMSWLGQVLATPGVDAVNAFDTANVHERSSLTALAPDLVSWRWFLSAHGFNGPLWVTEHGYPADPAYQYDPAYSSGPDSQAAYLTASIPTLIDAGASEVFVTERDNLGGQFASEGVLAGGASDPAQSGQALSERPAYAAVRAIVECYLLLARNCPASLPTATPAALAIAATRIGGSSSGTISVSDSGPSPLQLSPAVLASGAAPGITVQQDACPGILEPSQTCTIQLHFAPLTGGAQAATLQVPTDSGTLNVPVSAVAPSVASLTSPQLVKPTFAALRADGVGYTQGLVLDLANPLSAPVRITYANLWGADPRQFHLPASACTRATLAPAATCRLSVLFEPTRVGTAHAELTLHGDGLPLVVALKATAYARPAVMLLVTTNRASCRSSRSGKQVLVGSDEPATVTWRAVRSRRTAAASCSASSPGGGRGTASGRSATTGRTATSARRSRVRGHRGYMARFRLLVAGGRHGLRPGVYELSVIATNRHGSSRARAITVTVAGKA
ncbi:MAG: choice-of-anchor D domain-containing protein [Solirubrobacteraceae bacterium]